MTLIALQDLFQRFREKATGLWRLGLDPVRTIYLDSGDIVFATSTHPEDRLTYLLVSHGKLTQSQLEYAMANLKPGLSIGKNLIEMGYITQRDLLDMARTQVGCIVQGALETPDLAPVFEARELDASVVRLPLDTPKLLLQVMLELHDRERLLELLGPLNQVVLLQGRRVQEMSLPADLAKLPPLLDGTHTLLELSRECLTEPLRLGTFALFLREIGWARLHEMPPLDRQALGLAFEANSTELEPLSPALPEPSTEPSPGASPSLVTVPSLFSTIEEAGRPTTNLEHLSTALDEALPMPEPLPEPIVESVPEPALAPAPASELTERFVIESGQAILPTPAFELPEIPEADDGLAGDEPAPALQIGEEPSVTIQRSSMDGLEPVPEAPSDPFLSEGSKPKRGWALLLGTVLLALVALWGVRHWRSRRKAVPAVKAAPVPAPQVPPVAPNPVPPAAAVPVPEATSESAPPQDASGKPEAAPETPKSAEPRPRERDGKGDTASRTKEEGKDSLKGVSVSDRLEALRRGEMEKACRQGEKHRKELKPGLWSLRLEIACQGDTLRRATDAFPGGKPDLFILPIRLRDGRTCYQVYYGRFNSEAAADKEVRKLPGIFREGGNRPRPFRLSEIPSRQ